MINVYYFVISVILTDLLFYFEVYFKNVILAFDYNSILSRCGSKTDEPNGANTSVAATSHRLVCVT